MPTQAGRRAERAWWGRLVVLAVLAAATLSPIRGVAQPVETDDPESAAPSRDNSGPGAERRHLEKKWTDEFKAGEHARAETTLRRLIKLDGDNFVHHYNLAIVLAAQEKLDESVEALIQAIAAGFTDLRYLERDRHLAPIREVPRYKALVTGWDAILDAAIDLRLESFKTQYGPKYITLKDDRLRLGYASAFEATSLGRAQDEIDKLARWWEEEVVAEIDGAAAIPALGAGGKDPSHRPDPWVLVFLPTKEDYARWAAPRFGEGWRQVGGSYSDDKKMLIAQDLGGTLRHEFWHVLHWRDMRRRGQMHPIWVMEGLCSLVEDVETGPDGKMVPLPSIRSNIAQRRLKGGVLLPWSELFDRKQSRFVTSSPLAHYAEARTVFLFLAQEGKLAAWYAAFVTGFDEDPTGGGALVAVFEMPLDRIEERYHAWLAALPAVAEDIPLGGANLPFTVEPAAGGIGTAGDGLQITTFPPIPKRERGKPAPERLRMRDVVTAIDGKPVRDLAELVRVLGECTPGQEVEVSFRRGTITGTARAVLVANRRAR
jgi:hypothetical protein